MKHNKDVELLAEAYMSMHSKEKTKDPVVQQLANILSAKSDRETEISAVEQKPTTPTYTDRYKQGERESLDWRHPSVENYQVYQELKNQVDEKIKYYGMSPEHLQSLRDPQTVRLAKSGMRIGNEVFTAVRGYISQHKEDFSQVDEVLMNKICTLFLNDWKNKVETATGKEVILKYPEGKTSGVQHLTATLSE